MVAPGTNDAQLNGILTAAMCVPNHGKLALWRFVVINTDRRDAFAALLQQAWRNEYATSDRPDIEATNQFARQAPASIVVFSTPIMDSKIPLWEQELSSGTACMAMLALPMPRGSSAAG